MNSIVRKRSRGRRCRLSTKDLRKAAANFTVGSTITLSLFSTRLRAQIETTDLACERRSPSISFLRWNKNARHRRESRSRRVGHGVRTLSNELLLRALVPWSFSFYDRFISRGARPATSFRGSLIPDPRSGIPLSFRGSSRRRGWINCERGISKVMKFLAIFSRY